MCYDKDDFFVRELFEKARAQQPEAITEARKSGDWTKVFSLGSTVTITSSIIVTRHFGRMRFVDQTFDKVQKAFDEGFGQSPC